MNSNYLYGMEQKSISIVTGYAQEKKLHQLASDCTQLEDRTNEDTYVIQQTDIDAIVGVFDGHAGPTVSYLLAKHLPQVLQKELHSTSANTIDETIKTPSPKVNYWSYATTAWDYVKSFSPSPSSSSDYDYDPVVLSTPKKNYLEGIVKSFNKINEALNNTAIQHKKDPASIGGSTAAISFIPDITVVDPDIYIANVGDSRIYDAHENILTVDHNLSNKNETTRIHRKHQWFKPKVMLYPKDDEKDDGSYLSMSRAFGDFNYNSIGVNAEPTVKCLSLSQLPQKDGFKFLIYVTDGVYNEFGKNSISDIVAASLKVDPNNLTLAANKIIYAALKHSKRNEIARYSAAEFDEEFEKFKESKNYTNTESHSCTGPRDDMTAIVQLFK